MASEPDLHDEQRRSWAFGASPQPQEPREPVSIRQLVDRLTAAAGRLGWDAPVTGFHGDPVAVSEHDDAVGVF